MLDKKTRIAASIVLIGIVLITLSQTVQFRKEVTSSFNNPIFGRQSLTETVENTKLKDGILYAGLACVVLGAVVFAAGSSRSKKTSDDSASHKNKTSPNT
jgi:uncharacterized membrane protein